MSRDPVCGKEVDALRARAVGIWGGRTYYFCSPEHKADFARDPVAYGEHGAREPTIRAIPPPRSSPTPAPIRLATPAPLRSLTPAPARLATPAPIRMPTPGRVAGKMTPVPTDASTDAQPAAPEPIRALSAGGSPAAAASDPRDQAVVADERAASPRGALVKLAIVCALALGAGLVFMLARG